MYNTAWRIIFYGGAIMDKQIRIVAYERNNTVVSEKKQTHASDNGILHYSGIHFMPNY